MHTHIYQSVIERDGGRADWRACRRRWSRSTGAVGDDTFRPVGRLIQTVRLVQCRRRRPVRRPGAGVASRPDVISCQEEPSADQRQPRRVQLPSVEPSTNCPTDASDRVCKSSVTSAASLTSFLACTDRKPYQPTTLIHRQRPSRMNE